ncbi:SRPBCC domain-containing protein [soil metagenome]
MNSKRTSLDRTSDREIVITRSFRAPASIVFDAYTIAENVRRWWAPKSRGVSLLECDVDLRAGGAYRYVLGRDGGAFAFFGKYVEVERPNRVVYTQGFEPKIGEPMPGEAVVTVTFEEKDGTTTLVARELYPSKEVLDGVLATGMEEGMRETFEQLDALIAEKAG